MTEKAKTEPKPEVKTEVKLPLDERQIAYEFSLFSYLIKQGMSIKYTEEVMRYVAVPEPDIITIFYDKKNPDTIEFSAIKNGVRVRIFCKFNKESQRFVPERMQIFPLRAFE
jgi:hypothetical protein